MTNLPNMKPILTIIVLGLSSALTNGADVKLIVDPETQFCQVVTDKKPTVSVVWDLIVQSFVVEDKIGPTLACAAYGTMHTAMYDAWAHFENDAKPTLVVPTTTQPSQRFRNGARVLTENFEGEKVQAMTYAAFFVLKSLFPSKEDKLNQELENQGMFGAALTTPRTIGETCANAVLEKYGGLDTTPFRDTSLANEIDQWTPERVPIDDPNGPLQDFLTPHFGQLATFGVESGVSFRPPPPKWFLLVNGEVDLNRNTVTICSTQGNFTIPITKKLIGTVINPEFIKQCEEVIDYSKNLDDRNKIIAEFWEDGGGTSYPPGTWMTFAQYVSARDDHSIDDDAKMFLALGNAVRDAGIMSWNAKMYYYYVRPVRAIRNLGKLGLIGDFSQELGGHVIHAYNVNERISDIMLAEKWLTHQTPGSDPSPPFPEYTSGHSTFSMAAAEVLKGFTGSNFFGASITIDKGQSRFEPGQTPASPVTLFWESFTEAADQAGVSRLHGGIHFADGDKYGRECGAGVGRSVLKAAKEFFDTRR